MLPNLRTTSIKTCSINVANKLERFLTKKKKHDNSGDNLKYDSEVACFTASRFFLSLHETIMILFVFYYRQYLSKRREFIIAIKTNTRISLAQLQFNAELLSFRVIWDEMLVLEIRIWVKFSLNAIFVLHFQVTQLKIVSNPFAKGFRDNDTNDEWVFFLVRGQSAENRNWHLCEILKQFFVCKEWKIVMRIKPQKCVIASSVSVWKWIRIKFWKRLAKNTRSYGWISNRISVSICFASRNISNLGARCYLLTSLSQQRKVVCADHKFNQKPAWKPRIARISSITLKVWRKKSSCLF